MAERDLNRIRLGEFLRSRRQRLQPGECGLPDIKSQRTKGLRREQVAELAGISFAYYSWIEQGRDLNLSRALMTRLAGALRLNHAEQKYIFTLAGTGVPENIGDEVPLHPTISHLIGSRSELCALLCDPWFNVLEATPVARRVFLVGAESWPEQNLIWQLCHDRAHASIWPDPESELRLNVGVFRQNLACNPRSTAGTRVLNELSSHPVFAEIWASQDVRLNPSPDEYFSEEPWELNHPSWGGLRVHRISLCLPRPHQWAVIICSPGDEETRRKFAHLGGSHLDLTG